MISCITLKYVGYLVHFSWYVKYIHMYTTHIFYTFDIYHIIHYVWCKSPCKCQILYFVTSVCRFIDLKYIYVGIYIHKLTAYNIYIYVCTCCIHILNIKYIHTYMHRCRACFWSEIWMRWERWMLIPILQSQHAWWKTEQIGG